MIKSIALAVATFCLSVMMPTISEAAPINGDPACGAEPCGPCVCYCPMVKYVPVYRCEKRCYDEPYQVAKKCVRYKPEYYTKTFCRQVPECYYTYETKSRKRYVSETKVSYVPKKFIVKKCIDSPEQSPCAQGNCAIAAPVSGGCEFAAPSNGGCGCAY